MDKQQAINQLKGQLKTYVLMITKKSKSGNYICPLCGSGTGKNGSGAFSIQPDGKSWTCFKCNQHGDLLDLIGLKEGITDFNGRFDRACEIFNIQIDRLQGASGAGAAAHQAQGQRDQSEANDRSKAASAEAPGVDYTAIYLEANKHLSETTYHRGISLETLNRFKVGFVPAWRHPKWPASFPLSPRLIIPTSAESYLARDTRPKDQIPDVLKNRDKPKVGHIHFFNIEALQTAKQPIYIVEGEIDALSIIDAGGEAIGLGSTAMVKNFFQYLQAQRKPPVQPLIIALDNDEAGKAEAEKLESYLKGLKLPFYRHNPATGHKDANEALQANREAFSYAVKEGEKLKEAEEKAAREAYLKTAASSLVKGFVHGIDESVNTPAISTGFKRLDAVLDGGLYEGLYVVGAISSLGKTTLVTQIADQMALNGQDVQIISLEMASNEIIAKSISRLTLQTAIIKGYDKQTHMKKVREITNGKLFNSYEHPIRQYIMNCVSDYEQYAKFLFIREGIGDIGVDQIRAGVVEHIQMTGRKPVVVVDYMQILAPYNERMTDKQNTDHNVMELKRISRDYKIPIIAISSFNRQSYENEVAMNAFKESGAIEYSSDVLIGLQLKGAGAKDFDVNMEKKKTPRDVELVILKNRNGEPYQKIDFKYYAKYNYFMEE